MRPTGGTYDANICPYCVVDDPLRTLVPWLRQVVRLKQWLGIY